MITYYIYSGFYLSTMGKPTCSKFIFASFTITFVLLYEHSGKTYIFHPHAKNICSINEKFFLEKFTKDKKLSWTYRNKKKRLGKVKTSGDDDNVQVQNRKGRIVVRNLSFKVKQCITLFFNFILKICRHCLLIFLFIN